MTDIATDGPDVTAAELALGVLDGDERAAALRRVLSEPAFAAEVARWRDQLALLYDAAPAVAPGPGLFDRIEASLDGDPAPAVAPPRGWVWPGIAGASGLAAAAALTLLVLRPEPAVLPPTAPPAPTAPAPLLVAAIAPTAEGEPVGAVYDARAGTIRLGAAALADARHDAELWVIGGDGVPYSLGLLRRGQATALPVAPANRARLTATAVLAVSIEPIGGSRTGAPTGPVVAKGALSLT